MNTIPQNIVPHKKYSLVDIERIKTVYPDLKLPGFATRANADGTVQFIPWQDATGGGRLNRFGGQDAPDKMYASALDDPFGELRAIKKRTARTQLKSLRDRVREDFLAGRVMPLEEIANYVDDPVRAKALRARTVAISEDDLDQVLKSFIHKAEKENNATVANKVTSHLD